MVGHSDLFLDSCLFITCKWVTESKVYTCDYLCACKCDHFQLCIHAQTHKHMCTPKRIDACDLTIFSEYILSIDSLRNFRTIQKIDIIKYLCHIYI